MIEKKSAFSNGQKVVCINNTSCKQFNIGDCLTVLESSPSLCSFEGQEGLFQVEYFVAADLPDAPQHVCDPQNVGKFIEWFNTRRGVAIWDSVNLSNPGITWTTPLMTSDGAPVIKPSWQSGRIIRVIQDPSKVDVVTGKVYKKFHVGVRQSGNGLSWKVTDWGSRRIRECEAKAFDEFGQSWHEFDYGSYENALIMVPGEIKNLSEFMPK